MGKKKKVAEAAPEADSTTASEVAVEPQPEMPAPTDEPAPKKKGRKKKVEGVATLADLAAAYATQMEEDGKSAGTIASYGMELRVAQDELGEGTLLTDLTPERVGEYFSCKRVTKLKSGKAKSQLSIDKTRRVLRLALVWAAERGIVAAAPIPDLTSAK